MNKRFDKIIGNKIDENEELKKENKRLRETNKLLNKRINELLDELVILKYKKRKYNLRNEEVKIKEKEYEEFRQKILKRDNYECVKCGCKNRLQVHHIISRKERPDLITDEDNCITLCIVCHAKTENYF